MYRILIVDDEPAGLNHVRMILQKKCPQYKIIGSANNGKEALDMIRRDQPDVLITDIRMPVMNGIEFVELVKQEFPSILAVIVSGYSEFEYAKSALKFGVCDYLLKPLVPSDMQKIMEKLEHRLNTLYYEKRNHILSVLCNGGNIGAGEVLRYFVPGRYYAAVFRRSGFLGRYRKVGSGVEIFSMEEEQIYIYGRDEMEGLYLFPENMLCGGQFYDFVIKIFEKEKRSGTYVTGIYRVSPFTLDSLGEVARCLYRRMDETIVIGVSRIQSETDKAVLERNPKERIRSEYIEEVIRQKKNGRLLEELTGLFRIWADEEYSQMYVEAGIRYIFQIIRNVYPVEYDFSELEFMLDDAFYYASNMDELRDAVISIIRRCIPDLETEKIDDKESLFTSIQIYLKAHMKEAMTLGDICRNFGVSQTSLSRMFRTYGGTSFSAYLMQIRIESAKQIMSMEPEIYIKDVAERVGYSDQFYFSRIFRSVTGVCPKEYMEQGEVRPPLDMAGNRA